MSDKRKCCNCAVDKPLEMFHRDKRGVHGRCYCCKDCARAKSRAWNAENKDRKAETRRRYLEENADLVREAKRRYRQENREQHRERDRAYAAANSARALERVRQWRKDNPERSAAMKREERALRLARMRLASPVWADRKKIKAIYAEADRVSRETGIPHHVDHILPISGKRICGLHVETNLRVIPASENVRKSRKEIEVVDGEIIPWAFMEGNL